MRKVIRIVGVGEMRTSKKGWLYRPLSVTYEDSSIEGEKAATINVGADALGEFVNFPFAPGNEMECYMHEANFSLFVDDVLAVR